MENATVQEDTRKYELMVIIDPDLGLDAIKKRLDEIRMLISKEKKGKIFFEEDWGMRDMTYEIKKRQKGYYALFDFSLDPGLMNEIDKTLRLETEVLRHLLVALPYSYEPRSYADLMAPKAETKEQKPAASAANIPTVKKAEEVKAVEEKEAPKKVVRKKEETIKETSLEDVDAKLKSIIDNPDINF